LGTWSTGWGYPFGYSYSNPYYVSTTTTPVYDYSQPIVVNDYSTVNNTTDQSPTSQPLPRPETDEEQAAYALSDQALASFKAGNYTAASAQLEQAIAKLPNDPVLHEVLALTMFAMGNYGPAAAILNNLMAVAPGMDWTTLSGLYGNIDDYDRQLDALDNYCQSHPTDAASHFVLAYQRLICGEPDEAAAALKVVVAQQPKDQVARRMLDSLSDEGDSGGNAPSPEKTTAEQVADDATGPTTDLIGSWQAERDGTSFGLTLDEGGSFSWKSITKGQDPIELKGTYTVANDMLILDTSDQGAMVGRAISKDTDRFAFVPVDGPPDDPGLSFGRLKR
jgi:tetratricopeptide (TPR) repeat protein